MTYNDFVNEFLGKPVDYDKAAGVQCVDLAKAYLKEVFEIPMFSVGSAKNYFEKFENYSALKGKFEKIKNTPDFVPARGDIAVWGNSVGGGHGHVAICTGVGNTRQFYSYDQNWNGKACKLVMHDYSGFLGVLRPLDRSEIEETPTGSYTVTADVNVRAGAGTNFNRIYFSQFTINAKSQVKKLDPSCPDHFPKGVKLTISQIKQVGGTAWGKCPSGWVCMNYLKKA